MSNQTYNLTFKKILGIVTFLSNFITFIKPTIRFILTITQMYLHSDE